jgi:hypothetical protein
VTPQPREVPAFYAERFASVYGALIAAVRLAIADGLRKTVPPAAPNRDLVEWQTRVLPLLEARYAAIEQAFAQFQSGNAAPIAERALEASGLAKNLDNFSLGFAGPEHEEQLNTQVAQVVLAAYPVYSAAGLG